MPPGHIIRSGSDGDRLEHAFELGDLLRTPARNGEQGKSRKPHAGCAHRDRWAQAVDERLAGAVAAVPGEDRGENCDAEDATELAQGVRRPGRDAFLAAS